MISRFPLLVVEADPYAAFSACKAGGREKGPRKIQDLSGVEAPIAELSSTLRQIEQRDSGCSKQALIGSPLFSRKFAVSRTRAAIEGDVEEVTFAIVCLRASVPAYLPFSSYACVFGTRRAQQRNVRLQFLFVLLWFGNTLYSERLLLHLCGGLFSRRL